MDTYESEAAVIMRCRELAQRIEELQPEATAQDVARLCLLLSNNCGDLDELDDRNRLQSAWKQTGLKLQLATDQHAAMTQELEELRQERPQNLHPRTNLGADPGDQSPKPNLAALRGPSAPRRLRN